MASAYSGVESEVHAVCAARAPTSVRQAVQKQSPPHTVATETASRSIATFARPPTASPPGWRRQKPSVRRVTSPAKSSTESASAVMAAAPPVKTAAPFASWAPNDAKPTNVAAVSTGIAMRMPRSTARCSRHSFQR